MSCVVASVRHWAGTATVRRWVMTSSPSFESLGAGAGRVALEEVVRAKRARPVTSVEELMAPGLFASDDEVDEFVAAVREWRQADLG